MTADDEDQDARDVEHGLETYRDELLELLETLEDRRDALWTECEEAEARRDAALELVAALGALDRDRGTNLDRELRELLAGDD